jgi:hypothetical protein
MDDDDKKPNALEQATESAKAVAATTADAADQALTAAGGAIKAGLRSALRLADSATAEARAAVAGVQSELDAAVGAAAAHQDAAFGAARDAVEHVLARPHLSYPLAALALVLATPPARRAVWRATLGRLRSPAACVEAAGRRVEDASVRLETLSQEARKLAAEAAEAEAELRAARNRLGGARAALQRVGGQLAGAERGAEGAARALRELAKPPPEALELRSRAAAVAKSLGVQRREVEGAVLRAARWDV